MNRKLPGLRPGSIRRYISEIMVLVDVSGSLSDNEIRSLVTTIYNIANTLARRVIVYPWDIDVYEPIHIITTEDIRRIKISGKGGTMLCGVLRKILENTLIHYEMCVIIISDWEIFDIDRKRTRILLRRIANNVKVTVFMSTKCRPPKIRKAVIIMVDSC